MIDSVFFFLVCACLMHPVHNACVDVCACFQFCFDDLAYEASMNSNVNWHYKIAVIGRLRQMLNLIQQILLNLEM